MATRMQQRRGTAAQWTSANPVLGAGEIGFETDTGKFKIGDGTNQWGDLAYFLDSTDAQGALEGYVLSTDVGVANGVASLDATGNVPVSQLGNIIDGAPDLLNTLNELAAALGDDPNLLLDLVQSVDNNGVQIGSLTNSVNVTLMPLHDTVVPAIQSSVSSLEESVGILQPALAAAEGEIDDLQLEITNIEGQVTTLEGEMDAVEANVTTLQGDVSSLQSDVALKATTDSPVFTGTVSLPSTTSIGDLSATEIGYLTTVSSDVQTQLNAKLDSGTASSTYAPLAGPSFTGTVTLPSTTSIGTVTDAEIVHLSGVTSAIQTQLDAKAPTADPTFTGTVSGITATMVGLGNVDNTSDSDKPISTATQTALDAKADLSGATFTGAVTIEGNLNVTGTTTTINATDLSVSDPLIYLASGQYDEDVLDVGFLAATGEAGGTEQDHLHSGLFRDASDGYKWKLVTNVPHPVANTVDVTNAEYETLVVGNLEATGVVFSDGTQTKQGVPSITAISQKTDSYTLGALTERDTIVEINKSTATTLTIPADGTLNFPVGTTLDIIRTGTGDVTIAGAGGVTVNATPGLKLRAQWSSATLLKRAANTWLVYGDLAS